MTILTNNSIQKIRTKKEHNRACHGRGGREEGGPDGEEGLVLPDMEQQLLGDKGKLLLGPNPVPKKRGERARGGVTPGGGSSRKGVAAGWEGLL